MVSCSLQSPLSSEERLSESALLTWAVLEALQDMPSTPEAQHEYEDARTTLVELLEGVCNPEGPSGSMFGHPANQAVPRDVVVGLTDRRNHGQPWSERDLGRLVRMAGSLSARGISIRLGRTEHSIRAKASAEGISLRNDCSIDSDESLFEEGLR